MSNAVGRPPFEITEEVLKEVKTLAGQGLTKEQIARCLGICYDTLNERQKDNSEFSEAIKSGQAEGVKTIANALFTAGKGGNITAQIFYLKNRSPKDWKDRQSTEVSGIDGEPIKVTVKLVSKGD
jgi:hypothetical protein